MIAMDEATLDDSMGDHWCGHESVLLKMIKKRRKWDWREKWWVDEYFNSFGLAVIFIQSHTCQHTFWTDGELGQNGNEVEIDN